VARGQAAVSGEAAELRNVGGSGLRESEISVDCLSLLLAGDSHSGGENVVRFAHLLFNDVEVCDGPLIVSQNEL
jgi:hypothetical protein